MVEGFFGSVDGYGDMIHNSDHTTTEPVTHCDSF